MRPQLTEDGRTTWVDGKPRIELRKDRPATRMRFTLAHEIAHVLIERDQTVARRTQGLNHDDVEILCDLDRSIDTDASRLDPALCRAESLQS